MVRGCLVWSGRGLGVVWAWSEGGLKKVVRDDLGGGLGVV